MAVIAVTYGYARVSKADDESRNLDTQLRLLPASYGTLRGSPRPSARGTVGSLATCRRTDLAAGRPTADNPQTGEGHRPTGRTFR